MSEPSYAKLLHSTAGLPLEVLRDILIPAILGKETDGILYWAGKDLARQFPVETEDDVSTIFSQLGFGDIKLQKKNKKQQVWIMSGGLVTDRLALDKNNFTLEAGFLAQQIELQTNATSEAQITEKKKNSVEILVQHNLKDTLTDIEPTKYITVENSTEESDSDDHDK